MPYLCIKQLTVGGVTYHPGERIPDGVILPERGVKLAKSGFLSGFCGKTELKSADGTARLFTWEEVAARVAEALAAAEKRMEERMAQCQGYAAELQETELGAYEGTVLISVKSVSDGVNEQITAVPANLEEIQQVFSILQMNAEEGAKRIADVTRENVLILLHAADSRKTIKNAVKEQAERLSSSGKVSGEPKRKIETAESGAEEADT